MKFEENELFIQELFSQATTPQLKYEKIEKNLVHGCQSTMFLYTIFKDGKVYFQTYSDALISQGLGTILCYLYSNLPPREVLTSSPIVLKKIGILTSISPTRAGGVKSLYQKMITQCTHFLTNN